MPGDIVVLSLVLNVGWGENLREKEWGCRMISGSDRLRMKHLLGNKMPDVCREWHNRAIRFLYWKNYWFFHLCHSFSFSFPRDLETCQSAWLKLTCHCLMTLNKKEHLQVLFCQSETFGPALGLGSCIPWWERYVAAVGWGKKLHVHSRSHLLFSVLN